MATISSPVAQAVRHRSRDRWTTAFRTSCAPIYTTGDDGLTVVASGSESKASPGARFDGSRAVALTGPSTAHALWPDRARKGRAPRRSPSSSRRSGLRTIFDTTLEYAKQREQFGVPIGSFQAIKHKFADMMIVLERARATGYFAALTIAATTSAARSPSSVAKAAGGRLPAPPGQGRHPDPRRHRLHVGARHAPRQGCEVERRSLRRHRANRARIASPAGDLTERR